MISYFFIDRLSKSWTSVNETIDLRISLFSFLAILLILLAVIMSGVLWSLILEMLDKKSKRIASPEYVRVHLGAWLLKYVPGQVGAFIYKISWGSKRGLKKTDVTLSFIYEYLFMTIASTLPTSIILLLFGDLSPFVNWILLFILLDSTLLLASRPVMEIFISIISKKMKFETINKSLIRASGVIKFSAIYCIPRLFNGLGFVAIAASITSIEANSIAPLAASYVLAGIIGVYAILVPSGLGVREAMIVLFSAGVIGTEEAIILAIVARFYATAADGLIGLIYSLMTVRNRREKT